jgi:HEPN domain-containing protein
LTEPTRPAQWLTLACDDLAAARVLAATGSFAAKECFLAQQCAERSLKAVLLARGVSLARTHDLGELLDLAQNAGANMPAELEAVNDLTAYAVERRYATLDAIAPAEVDRALSLAAAALTWAKSHTAD